MRLDSAKTHCRRCGAPPHASTLCLPQRGINWIAVMAHRIKPGVEMTLEEIGRVAGCSRERIRQIEFAALRKLAVKAPVRLVVKEALEASRPGY